MNLRYQIIKHKIFKDVCFDVEKVFTLPHKMKIKGNWINLGFVSSYPLNVKQTITILRDDYKDWEYCLTPEDKCLRNSKWKSIV